MDNRDKGTISLEIATDDDKDELTGLFRKLYEGDEEQRFFRSEAIPSYFNAGSRVFVAREDGKLVSFVWAVFYEHIMNKGVGIIEELYVADGYRRKGIGKALVLKAVDFLKEHTIVTVVTTSPEMHDAQEFYKALGFKESKEWFYYAYE
ncbi:MAG: GNAT family N-acetyltransferase [Candidatus Micrarchaeia archaeon]